MVKRLKKINDVVHFDILKRTTQQKSCQHNHPVKYNWFPLLLSPGTQVAGARSIVHSSGGRA